MYLLYCFKGILSLTKLVDFSLILNLSVLNEWYWNPQTPVTQFFISVFKVKWIHLGFRPRWRVPPQLVAYFCSIIQIFSQVKWNLCHLFFSFLFEVRLSLREFMFLHQSENSLTEPQLGERKRKMLSCMIYFTPSLLTSCSTWVSSVFFCCSGRLSMICWQNFWGKVVLLEKAQSVWYMFSTAGCCCASDPQ